MVCLPLCAQQTNTVIPPSPDAAALGKYGNIPVSTYTGVPNISVPLYDLNYRDLHIPIDLSYHASGVTVEEDASWVGLGWVLNCGGVITRTVRGGDDMEFAHDRYSNVGTYGYLGYPYDGNLASGDFLQKVCIRDIDPEPDLFYFNFLGKSGSFVLPNGQDKTLNFVSAAPLKAEKIDIKYDKVNLRWQIKTADGYTYYFKTKEVTETLHGTIPYGSGPDRMQFDSETHGFLSYDDIVVSSWYLDKIVSPSGVEVNYIYDTVAEQPAPGYPEYSLYGSAKIVINDVKETVIDPNAEGECYKPSYGGALKVFTKHIYLKEIVHPLGKITFSKSLREDMMPASGNVSNYPYLSQPPFWLWSNQLGPQKLDNIEFRNNSDELIKRIELLYNYFNASVIGNDKYSYRRLKLEAVRECGISDCKQPYQLLYNEINSLPSKYSFAQDFWGYYNGAISNISRIPYGTYYDMTTSKYFYIGDSDRQPNSNYTSTAILNKVIYPTGGVTEFEFENHAYYNFSDDAFTYTDFENYAPVYLNGVVTNGSGAEFQTVTFTLTEPVQELIIDGTMTYYRSADASEPCNVINPTTFYSGSEPWYSLRSTSSTSSIVTRTMSDFLNYFASNYNNHCITQPTTPEQINPIYSKKERITLNAGTYELKVYSRAEFNISVFASENHIRTRVVKSNAQGIYAKNAGGLRIKRIITREQANAVPQVMRYDYTYQGADSKKYSTGRLMLYPSYHIPHHCTDDFYKQAVISMLGRSWSNSPLATSASGSIVGYDKVTELHGDNAENGKTEYFYLNEGEEPLDMPFLIEGLPTRKRSSNGLVLDVKHYTAQDKVVKTENYLYTPQLQQFFKGYATKQLIVINWGIVNSQCHPQFMVYQEYNVTSDRWVVTKKTERLYSQNSDEYTQIVTDFSHDTETHLQVKSEQQTSSNGDVIRTEYLYPPDASWIPLTMWQDKFIYERVVQKKVYKNDNLIITNKNHYDNSAFLSKEEVAFGASALEAINNYKYSSKGNVLEVTSRDGSSQVYLWGYKSSYPIASIKNATLTQVYAALNVAEVALDLLAEANMPSSDYINKINNLRIALPNTIVNTFTYKPLVGLKTAVDANGNITSYEYDDFGRLSSIKDNNGNLIKVYSYRYKQ